MIHKHWNLNQAFRGLAVACALAGCVAANRPAVAPGALDVSRILPAPTSGPHEARIAHQPGARPGAALDTEAELAPYLLQRSTHVSAAARPVSEERTRTQPRVPSISTVVRAREAEPRNAPTGLPGPERAASSDASAGTAPSQATAPEAFDADAERYAQRQDRRLERFRGGNVIVISVAAVVVVLLVVLLLVLLL